MEIKLTCAECEAVESVDIETIHDLMDGKPDGRRKQWKVRWVENVGPQYICPDEKYDLTA